jgi:hypothetical protein
MNIVVLVLIALMVVVSYRKYRQDAKYKIQARSHVFEDCLVLLEQAQVSWDKANLPLLKGSYAGYQVALSIVEDTLGWRKIPPLWLLIKVIANKPSQGTLDLIARPSNNEFYSPSWEWDGNLTIPSNWPQHAIIKYEQEPVDISLLEPYVPQLFADEKMKELLITPTMVRLTYMVNQAERGEYLIMRNAVYEDAPISKSTVETLLKQAIAMRLSMENTEIKPN